MFLYQFSMLQSMLIIIAAYFWGIVYGKYTNMDIQMFLDMFS